LAWKNHALQNALVAVDEKWRAAQAKVEELKHWDAVNVTVVSELNAQFATMSGLLRMARELASLAAAAGDCPYQLAREFLAALDAGGSGGMTNMALEQALAAMTERAELAETKCATLREALEPLRQLAEIHRPLEWNTWDAAESTELWGMFNKEQEVNLTVGDLHRAVSALATDAGAKMLAVVKAVRAFVTAHIARDEATDEGTLTFEVHNATSDAFWALLKAVAALDAKEVR
jgi:hypothetical protein